MSERRGRRGGGRAGRQAARASTSAAVRPYLERKLPPVDMLDEEGLARIEANAEVILSEVGIAFQEFPEAYDKLKKIKLKVGGKRQSTSA